jgi:sortase (surface protein transpeptidase)
MLPAANAPDSGPAGAGGSSTARFPGTRSSGPYAASAPTVVELAVPSVGLRIPVVDYRDCSGLEPMTRATAVQYTCTPDEVLALMGHNPGVFTPLLRTHPGDRVIYSDGLVQSIYEIRSAARVSPDAASRAGQDGSFPHMLLATCAAPDASSYWIFIAVLIEGPGPAASAGHMRGTDTSHGSAQPQGATHPDGQSGSGAGSGSNKGGPQQQPSPRPSSSPSPPPQQYGPVALPTPLPL